MELTFVFSILFSICGNYQVFGGLFSKSPKCPHEEKDGNNLLLQVIPYSDHEKLALKGDCETIQEMNKFKEMPTFKIPIKPSFDNEKYILTCEDIGCTGSSTGNQMHLVISNVMGHELRTGFGNQGSLRHIFEWKPIEPSKPVCTDTVSRTIVCRAYQQKHSWQFYPQTDLSKANPELRNGYSVRDIAKQQELPTHQGNFECKYVSLMNAVVTCPPQVMQNWSA